MDVGALLRTLRQSHLFWWITAASVVMFLVIGIATVWIVVRLPVDYFQTERPHLIERLRKSSISFGLLLVLKNILALFFLVAGILMLVLPGQGWLSILISFILMDFPYKKQVEGWIIRRKPIGAMVNWIRRMWGCPKLQLDEG